MKIDTIQRYEIVADAFRRCTGQMAPGKDLSWDACACASDFETRRIAWGTWCRENRLVIDAMLSAFCAVMPHDEPETATEALARKG